MGSAPKLLGYVSADSGVAALVAWCSRGLVPGGDWLAAERVFTFAVDDPDDVTETMPNGDVDAGYATMS